MPDRGVLSYDAVANLLCRCVSCHLSHKPHNAKEAYKDIESQLRKAYGQTVHNTTQEK